MKEFFKPARIAFYIFMLLTFFMVGLYYASWIDAGKGQGLAGGAIVLGYGVLFSVLAIVASFFIARLLPISTIKILNWCLLIVLIATWGNKFYQARQKEALQKDNKTSIHSAATSTPYATEATALNTSKKKGILKPKPPVNRENVIGLGFFTPNFVEYPTLYFYGPVNLEKELLEHAPQDSLVTSTEPAAMTANYGPPWLVPEHFKMDYGLVYFKVLGIGYDFLKVEGNKMNKQLAYVSKNQGTYLSWAEFLVTINSVEFKETQSQVVKTKPLDHALKVETRFDFIKPLLVEGDWLYGMLQDQSFREVGRGWIRWRQGDTLLIRYSLLS